MPVGVEGLGGAGEDGGQFVQGCYPGAVVDVGVVTAPVEEDGMHSDGTGAEDIGLVLVADVDGLFGLGGGPPESGVEDGRSRLFGAGFGGAEDEIEVPAQSKAVAELVHVAA